MAVRHRGHIFVGWCLQAWHQGCLERLWHSQPGTVSHETCQTYYGEIGANCQGYIEKGTPKYIKYIIIHYVALPGSILENWPRDATAKGAWIWVPCQSHAASCKRSIGMGLVLNVRIWVARQALCSHSPRVVAHLPTKPHWLASQHRTMYNAVLPRGTWALMAAMAKAPAQLCGLAKGSNGRSSFQGGELPSNTSSRWDLGHTGRSWEISVVAQLCLPVAFLCISVTFRAEPKMIAVAPNTKPFDLKKHHTMPHFLRYTDRRCHHVAWGMLTPRKVKSRHVGWRHSTEGRQHCITLQHRDGLGKQPTSAPSSWHMFWFNLIPWSTLLTHNHTPYTNLWYWEPDYLSHCFNSWTTASERVKSGKIAIGPSANSSSQFPTQCPKGRSSHWHKP